MRRHSAVAKGAALAVCVAIGAVGCSSSGSGAKPVSKPTQPAQTPQSVAAAYFKAMDASDWKRMCELSTEANRAAQIEQSDVWRNRNVAAMPAPTMSNCVTAHQHDKQETPPGGWIFDTQVDVPAYGAHPAGVGLRAHYNFTEEGKPQTYGDAVRLVRQQDGSWLVDQIRDLATPESSDPQKVVIELNHGDE